jgi:hypothetical protein
MASSPPPTPPGLPLELFVSPQTVGRSRQLRTTLILVRVFLYTFPISHGRMLLVIDAVFTIRVESLGDLNVRASTSVAISGRHQRT